MVFRWFKRDKSKSETADRKTSSFEIPKYKLKIETNVPAEVYINRIYKGTTPLTIEISKGKHKLKLRKSGYYPIVKDVWIDSDQTLSFELKAIPKYKLRIEANIPADVFIDGKYRGTTPLTVEVIKGKHEIKLEREGFKTIKKVIKVRRDETLNFNLELLEFGLLWSYETGDLVNSVAISSDGEYIVAGGEDYKVYFFDRSGKLLWSYETGDKVLSVAISSDGNYVAAGSWDYKVYFFDRSGKLLWSYKTGSGVESVAISSDGKYVVAGSDKVYLIDRSGKLLWSYKTGDIVWSVAVSSDGNYIVAGGEDYKVYFFDRSGKLLWSYETGSWVWSVAISSDGRYVVAGSSDYKVYFFDRSGKLLWSYETVDAVRPVAISSDGKYVVASDGYVGSFFDRSGKLLWSCYATEIAISSDGEYIVAGGEDYKVYFFDRSGKLLWSYETVDAVRSVAISSDGKYVVADSADRKVYFFCSTLSINEIITKINELKEEIPIEFDISKIKSIEEAKLVLSQLKEIEEKLEIAKKIEQTIKSNPSVKIPEEVLRAVKEFKSGNYDVDLNKAKEILDETLENYAKAMKMMDELRNKSMECEKRGIALKVEKPIELFENGKYEDCLKECERLLKVLDKTLENYTKARELVKDVIDLSKRLNVNLKELRLLTKLFEEGKYEECIKMCEEITQILKLKEDLTNGVNDLEKYANVDSIRSKLKEIEGREIELKEISSVLHELKNDLAEITGSKPNLRIELKKKKLKLNYWDILPIEIKNEGYKHVYDLSLVFSGDFEVINPNIVKIVEGMNSVNLEVSIKPKSVGRVPLIVNISYKDKDSSYQDTKTITIDVLEGGIITPTTPKTFPQELAENYVEVEFIGKGGFAHVFKAKRKDGKVVAVKIPISPDPATGKSFLRELMNWTKLEHENVVKVYDYNILPIPYFEMELCDKSLAELPKPMDVEEASWIIFNIAEGLKYAHKQGVIHRDLKPQNIMLKDGIPKISDWGLSKVMAESTSTSITAFTPHYAAPEQISKKFGDKKDPRVDLWQLGVVFYELVTGELPFKGEDPTEILSNVIMIDPIPPSQLNPKAKGVEHVIMRCLQKEQSKRYNSVEELQRDLSKILNVSYQTSLNTSVSEKNFRRSAYYCGELLLINLKVGDLFSAYKFATDLMNYASEEFKPSIAKLCDELEFWLKREFSEDDIQRLIKMADIIVHKLRVGFKR